jgi:hypothetical protein
MVLGIIAAVMAVLPGVSFGAWLFAVPAIILGIIGMRKAGAPRGRALAGLIEGGAALVVAIAVSAAAAGSVSDGFKKGYEETRAESAAQPTETPAAKASPDAVTAKETPKAAPAETKAPAPAPAPAPEFGSQPADEVAFVTAIATTKNELSGDLTDLQRSEALRTRDASLCSVLGDGAATDWTGKVKDIGANGEGKAYVEVEIASGVTIKTWNNAFSDVVDGTLIDPSSPFFSNLVAMKEGQMVKFSVQMVADEGSCLSKGNLTETFYGLTPEFIAHFTNVQAA